MKFVQRCSRPCRSIVTDSQHCCVKSSDRRLRQTANNIKRGIKRDWYCRVFPRDNFDVFFPLFFFYVVKFRNCPITFWPRSLGAEARGSCSLGEKNIYFDHGAVDRHLDDVEGVIVPATVIVEADLPS